MKKPSEYSSAELLELENNIFTVDRAKLETFARLGVMAQQWMNRHRNMSLETHNAYVWEDGEDANDAITEACEVIGNVRTAFNELPAA